MDPFKDRTHGDAPEAVKSDLHQAPEVVTTYQPAGADGLQTVERPASEGPEALDARPYYSQSPAYSGYNKDGGNEFSDQTDGEHGMSAPARTKKRRRWMFGASIVILLIIIAVAIGVGVGVTQNDGSGGGNAQNAQA